MYLTEIRLSVHQKYRSGIPNFDLRLGTLGTSCKIYAQSLRITRKVEGNEGHLFTWINYITFLLLSRKNWQG